MALFNFFKKKSESPNLSLILPTEEEPENEVSQETESSNIEEAKAPAVNSLKVSYATGWPIDLIYGYLHKNYEEKGYADAMLNSNLTFRDMNMSIIRNKVLMIFREVNLKYDGMKRELETRIGTCNAAGLLTSVAELEKQMAVINLKIFQLEIMYCTMKRMGTKQRIVICLTPPRRILPVFRCLYWKQKRR